MESNWSMFRFKFLLLVGINSPEDYTCQWKIAIGKWFKETLLLGNYWGECLSNFFYRHITWVVTWVQLRRIIFRCSLTLKWPRYFYSRWCPRGVPWTPWENYFSTGILQWNLHHICTGNKKKKQFCKKNQNVVPFQNGGQRTDLYFATFRFWPNFENPLSQRNFSMKFGSKKENMNRFTLLK